MSERLGILVAGAAVLIAAIVLTLVWAGEKRDVVASTPQPPPLYETDLLGLKPGEKACWGEVTLVPSGTVAQFRVTSEGGPPVPLTFSVSAPGYRSSVDIPATWRDNDLLTARIDPPPRPLHGEACVEHTGTGTNRVGLYAAEDQSPILDASAAGRDKDEIPVLRFVEDGPGTVGGHASEIADAIGAFRPGFVGPWLVWLLLVLVVVGLPAGLTFALWRAVREP